MARTETPAAIQPTNRKWHSVRLSAVRGDSFTGTALQGNVTVTSPSTPGQFLAVHEVFNTSEFVEWILTSLPPFD